MGKTRTQHSRKVQGNLKKWHEAQWTYVCECEEKATKVGLTASSVTNSV